MVGAIEFQIVVGAREAALNVERFASFGWNDSIYFCSPVDEFEGSVELDRDLDAYGYEASEFETVDGVVT